MQPEGGSCRPSHVVETVQGKSILIGDDRQLPEIHAGRLFQSVAYGSAHTHILPAGDLCGEAPIFLRNHQATGRPLRLPRGLESNALTNQEANAAPGNCTTRTIKTIWILPSCQDLERGNEGQYDHPHHTSGWHPPTQIPKSESVTIFDPSRAASTSDAPSGRLRARRQPLGEPGDIGGVIEHKNG